MNKTTIKISVLAFLGFMTYGYAQQQQQDPYKGKVGINTVTPSATMDVQPNSDNARVEAKTNEGIIAPKLSKTRIANIETPVEGTLVYATDETTSPISAYTGGDTKVAKITEKGYYFYNGTEWVKAGSDGMETEWVYDNSTKRVNLKRSGINTKKVFYNEYGGLRNMDFGVKRNSLGNLELDTVNLDLTASNHYSATYKLASQAFKTNYSNVNYLNRFFLAIDANTDNSAVFNANASSVVVGGDTYSLGNVPGKMARAVGNVSDVTNNNGEIVLINGYRSRVRANEESIGGSLAGADIEVEQKSTSNVNHPIITGERLSVKHLGTSVASQMFGTVSNLKLGSTATATDYTGVRTTLGVDAGGTVVDAYGLRTSFAIANGAIVNNLYGMQIHTSPILGQIANKQYGIFIQSINKAVNPKNNYAIYSEAGQVRFGDLAGTGDRIVVADQDGVLKTSQFVMKATDTTDGCSASNAGAIHYKEIDKGGKMVGVFGFCTRDTQGNYKWAYNMGGANMLDGTGAFGSGL